jgi:hypothetical protein
VHKGFAMSEAMPEITIDTSYLYELGDDAHFQLPPKLQQSPMLSAHTKPIMSGPELAVLVEKASLLIVFEVPRLTALAAENENFANLPHISNRQRKEYRDSAEMMLTQAMDYEEGANAYLLAVATATAVPHPGALTLVKGKS